jgi:RimJ/RimL family protein N-acetyltransferase
MCDATAPISLETRRFLLRALDASDEQLFCDLFVDPHTMRFVGAPWTPERAARGFRAARLAMQRRPRRAVFLTLIEKAVMQAIGLCSIQDIDAAARRAELGLMLTAAACGRGFAKELLAGATDWAFRDLPIDELKVRFATTHVLAERVAVGTGYRRSGYATHAGAQLCSWSAYRDSWRGTGAAPRAE